MFLAIGVAVPAEETEPTRAPADAAAQPDASDAVSEEPAEGADPATDSKTATSANSGAATPAPAQKPKEKPQPRTFVVAEVLDGDTIKLANGKSVRLAQIDSPELNESECYGAEARATLAKLLPAGKAKVRLEYDPALDKTDAYGRDVAYIFKGGENVNHTLVVRGASSVWFYEGAKGKYASKLDNTAKQAKANGRGLWGACSATDYDPFNAVETRTPPPPEPEPAPAQNCHPSYEGACLDPTASDYDCAGGSGDGPLYTGPVRVVGYDEYGLDRDGDGSACE